MNNQKVCTFFISENHLLTIVLPYINEKILEEKEIVTILQKDITNEIKKYLKNVKEFECEKEKILNLNWKKTKNEFLIEDLTEKIVIIVGENKFVERINKILEINKNIYEILNCYQIECLEDINNVITEHCMVLNTEGKFKVEKNSQDEQKRRTIKSQL